MGAHRGPDNTDDRGGDSQKPQGGRHSAGDNADTNTGDSQQK